MATLLQCCEVIRSSSIVDHSVLPNALLLELAEEAVKWWSGQLLLSGEARGRWLAIQLSATASCGRWHSLAALEVVVAKPLIPGSAHEYEANCGATVCSFRSGARRRKALKEDRIVTCFYLGPMGPPAPCWFLVVPRWLPRTAHNGYKLRSTRSDEVQRSTGFGGNFVSDSC